MVIAQPHVLLTQVEPYKCTSVDTAQQVIAKTLDVALSRPHGLSKTHFTIFPEYSIPGLEGIDKIESVLFSRMCLVPVEFSSFGALGA